MGQILSEIHTFKSTKSSQWSESKDSSSKSTLWKNICLWCTTQLPVNNFCVNLNFFTPNFISEIPWLHSSGKRGVEIDQSKIWAAFRILLSILKATYLFASNYVRDSYIQKRKKFTVNWICLWCTTQLPENNFYVNLNFFTPNFISEIPWIHSSRKNVGFYFLYFEQLITLSVL